MSLKCEAKRTQMEVPRMVYKDVISGLGRKIDEVIEPILSHGSRCALLDFPNHGNVGDNAIWLGERAYLQGTATSVVYACEIATYSERELRERLNGGIILIHGGGNLGDVWPAHQQFREQVIAAFHDCRVIQLPQSVHFQEKANLQRARAAFNAHPDLTILVRDVQSLEFIGNEFRVKSALCPDMAFALGPLQRPAPPRSDIVWLSRTDVESLNHSSHISPEVGRTDWLKDERSPLIRLNWLLTRRLYCYRHGLPWFSGVLSRMYDRVAEQRLLRGRRTLGCGKVVITDRLHGHILSLLMGIPHVVLDNNYGKVSSFYETWTKGCGVTVWADTLGEAFKQARALVMD
jgi:exopolysaccharide biosynthesis predicted pyruvyltransferase EpsI